MARILHKDEWYDELGSGSLYEAEFERVFQQYVPKICPGFIAVPFKKTVYSDDTSARADLALIRTDYLNWWIVEVERSDHSLYGHVLPQIRTFSAAYYGREEALYLSKKSDRLNSERLFDMIRGDQPRILVVVDTPRDDWSPVLEENNAKLAVFQIFRSERDRYLFRIDGYLPTIEKPIRSPCFFEPLLPNLLRVQNPAILPADLYDKIPIYYRGKLSLWRRIDTSDKVWLISLMRIDLDPSVSYEITPEADILVLRRLESTGR